MIFGALGCVFFNYHSHLWWDSRKMCEFDTFSSGVLSDFQAKLDLPQHVISSWMALVDWCGDRAFNFVMDDKSDVCVTSRWCVCALRCVRFNRRRKGVLLWSSQPSTNERSLRLIAVESWLCNRRYHRALLLVYTVLCQGRPHCVQYYW